MIHSTPPPIAAPAPARYPVPIATTLPNGLRVVAVRIPGVAISAAQLIVPVGSLDDPDGAAGTASLAASLLARGTAAHDARAIAIAQDSMGATLSAGAGLDRTAIATSALAARFPDALALMADVVQHPVFPAGEVAVVKSRTGNELRLRDSDPSALAAAVAPRALYDDAFGRPVNGTQASIAAITRDSVASFYAAHYAPRGSVLAIAGDLAPRDAFALAQGAFGGWSATAPAPQRSAPHAAATRIVVIDQAAAGRTAIIVAAPSVARGNSGYPAAVVANAVLAGYSGRLNQEVRVKRGLSYGAGSSVVANAVSGTAIASTLVAHEKAAEALEVVIDAINSVGSRPAGAAELGVRRQVIVGSYAAGLETPSGIVGRVADDAFVGLPPAAIARYPALIDDVTAASVRAIGTDRLAGPHVVVLVGKASTFLDALKAKHPDVIVIPAASLDLASPALK